MLPGTCSLDSLSVSVSASLSLSLSAGRKKGRLFVGEEKSTCKGGRQTIGKMGDKRGIWK